VASRSDGHFAKSYDDLDDPNDAQLQPAELVWVESSRKDLRDVPPTVRRGFGVALFALQVGETPPSARPLEGFPGTSVLELIEDQRGDIYRAIYTGRFPAKVYVLHLLEQKSKSGIAPSLRETELIRRRFRLAQALYSGID
jgi:phage-related protein